VGGPAATAAAATTWLHYNHQIFKYVQMPAVLAVTYGSRLGDRVKGRVSERVLLQVSAMQ